MRPVIWLTVAGLAVVLGFMAFVVRASSELGLPWSGRSPHILIAMGLGVVGSGALAAGLMWLAFFSARRGYDERADYRDDDT